MKHFHANRLVKLAQHLVTVPSELFELYSFAEGHRIDYHHLTKARLNSSSRVKGCSAQQLVDVNCGTTACALGWAATIPAFRKAGLSLDIIVFANEDQDDYEDDYSSTPSSQTSSIYGDIEYKLPDGNSYVNFEAGLEFFGLTGSESYYLFDPNEYYPLDRNIPGVVKRIEEVLDFYGYTNQSVQVHNLTR